MCWLGAKQMHGKSPLQSLLIRLTNGLKNLIFLLAILLCGIMMARKSVLQVTKEGYATCNTTNPIEEYKDGNTKVNLDRSGPFYFISGAQGHCEKGQKLAVVVLSQKHRHTGISPAPSPAEFEGPAVAPTSSASTLRGAFLVALGFLSLGLF